VSVPKKTFKSPLNRWTPEDYEFWNNTGKPIARKNLIISVFALMLAFCVWMLFSTVAVNLGHMGFTFTVEQLFLLTALPSLSGALFRVPYSFAVPLLGGRLWTTFSTIILVVPCIWLGVAVRDPHTPFPVFVVISLLCGLAGANFASSMGNISLFYPKKQQGAALGINGGLGNLGVSIMQWVAPLVMVVPFFTSDALRTKGSDIWLENAAWIWVPLLVIAAVMAWRGMDDIAGMRVSFRDQLPVLKRPHMWALGLLYLATFGSFIGFSAGFAMLAKTQYPGVNIVHYAFLGPLIGALARSLGGFMSDRWGGVKMTILNFSLLIALALLLFLTLPENPHGSFMAFYLVFMGLFLAAGLGSGSTFQMIAVIFRQVTVKRLVSEGHNEERAQHTAVTDTAAALGFISALGAAGGFFHPQNVWDLAGANRLACGGDEDIYCVLCFLPAVNLAGIWPSKHLHPLVCTE